MSAAAAPEEESAASGVDVDRYCQLRRQLAQSATEFFREHRGAGERASQAAGRDFLREQAASFAELEQVAPASIRGDVRTFVRASRAFLLGSEEGPAPIESRAAELRLADFDRASCGR